MAALATFALLVVGFVVAFPGSRAGVVGGATAGFGASLGSMWRDRDYLGLPNDQRATVRRTMRTGAPVGDPHLDDVAVRRSEEAARTIRSERVLLPLLVALCVAVGIVIALRSGWWAFTVVPSAVLFSHTAWLLWRYDPRPRLAELRAAMR